MLGFLSFLLALPAVFLVSGILDIPLWYGMTVGSISCISAFVEILGSKAQSERQNQIRSAWIGLILGGGSFLVGLAIYVAAWIWAVN